MSKVIETIERRQVRRSHPQFRMGDRVRVHFQVVEGTRRRTQIFEGVVIRLHGAGARKTFTVRKLSFGVGVERTFPLFSPKVERIDVVARGQVRRAKLYYLRGRVGRRARVRERRHIGPEELGTTAAPEEVVAGDGAVEGDGVVEGADDAAASPPAEAIEGEAAAEEAVETESASVDEGAAADSSEEAAAEPAEATGEDGAEASGESADGPAGEAGADGTGEQAKETAEPQEEGKA
jgi:large subunit ribosomal protein L19